MQRRHHSLSVETRRISRFSHRLHSRLGLSLQRLVLSFLFLFLFFYKHFWQPKYSFRSFFSSRYPPTPPSRPRLNEITGDHREDAHIKVLKVGALRASWDALCPPASHARFSFVSTQASCTHSATFCFCFCDLREIISPLHHPSYRLLLSCTFPSTSSIFTPAMLGFTQPPCTVLLL